LFEDAGERKRTIEEAGCRGGTGQIDFAEGGIRQG